MKDNWRLDLHLMPPQGWLNDPNGLCWYQGEYHVFFQYSPEDANGGLKHWGHYKSKDLINWEFTGIPVLAEESYEKDGAYSGCAFVEDDVMHLFYTGNVKEEGNFDYITAGRGANVIHAIYDGGDVVKDKKCILTNVDYPEYYTCHVRDPKVWKEENTYYMVLGGRDRDDKGRVLVYSSDNLLEWTFVQDVMTEESFGYMWECPDYFEVDDTKLLSISPQGLETNGHDYENIYQSGYFQLNGNVASDYTLTEFTEWDHGFDFYAPQTFEDNQGRRILIGWMGIPDADYTNPTVERGWQHALTMPRVIEVKDGKVIQNPVPELMDLRKESVLLKNEEEVTFDVAELCLSNPKNQDFIVQISEELNLCYICERGYVTLAFVGDDLGAGRDVRHCDIEECKNVRIFMDRSAVEVYLNDGEKVLTSRYYPAEGMQKARVKGADVSATLWTLRK